MNPRKFRGWCENGCGNEIKRYAKRYCSLFCFHQNIYAKKARRHCGNGCGKLIKGRAKQYCSLKCMHAHRRLVEIEAFLARGGIYGFVGPHFLARALRHIYGERCTRCGWSERHQKTGRVPVEVEHIDGDWQNNFFSNLTLLCPNCHALTPTFRGLNRGRGRATRLGGRANPISVDRQKRTMPRAKGLNALSSRKVVGQAANQLGLLTADVAKLVDGTTLVMSPQKWARGFESHRRLHIFDARS